MSEHEDPDGAFLSLFGRKAKCYSCGGDYGLQKCSCGRHYCAAHGYAGKCFECQTGSMGEVVPPEILKKEGSRAEDVAGKGEKELIPRIITASFHHGLNDLEKIRSSLASDFERYHPVFFAMTGVESNHEIRCFYDIQYVISRVTAGPGELNMVTDLKLVPRAIFAKDSRIWTSMARERPLEDETFTYLLQFLHNEVFFICELVLTSMGGKVSEVKNDLPMEVFSPRILGPCPWCGTVARGLATCHTCGKAVPDEMGVRTYLRTHAKRHYSSRLLALTSGRTKDAGRRALADQVRSRLDALDRMKAGEQGSESYL